jgi:hypothetical protein
MALDIAGINVPLNLPTISSAGIGFWVIIILAFVLFIIVIGIVIYMIYMRRLFNKPIIIFENISGNGYMQTGKDIARTIKLGDGGEELLFLRKRKIYRTAYGRKMGKNVYWFAVGQDGYWYNILLGDLDAKMGMLDIEPIDRDMRYMHVAIRKNIESRYRKIGIMEKFGPIIVSGVFLIIMVVATWLLMSKAGDLIHEAKLVVESVKPMIDALTKIAGSIDSIYSGGSGIHPA